MNAQPNVHWLPAAAAAKPQRLMEVTVKLPDAEPVRYQRAYASSFDAYDDALTQYAACLRITVKPIPVAEVQA